jgi:hypothetical protein
MQQPTCSIEYICGESRQTHPCSQFPPLQVGQQFSLLGRSYVVHEIEWVLEQLTKEEQQARLQEMPGQVFKINGRDTFMPYYSGDLLSTAPELKMIVWLTQSSITPTL